MWPPPFTFPSQRPSPLPPSPPHPPVLPLLTTLLPLLLLLQAVPTDAHGYLSHPPARVPGPALLSACGPAIFSAIQRDNTSHIEGLPDLALLPSSSSSSSSGYNASLCNLWLCRGLQFSDNPADNVQTWHAGQVVRVKVKITIPHEGVANVSVVDAGRNEILRVGAGGGEEDGGVKEAMLMSWERGYANEKEFFEGRMPANVTEFNVTIPELGGRCERAGDCVLQWWWYGKGAKQTYESCVDFVMVPAGDRKVNGDVDDDGLQGWRRWIWGVMPWSRTRVGRWKVGREIREPGG